MGSERRGRAVHGRLEVNPSGEEPTDRPRQKNAGLWEPYDGRLSRTVLREREGEVPSRYSPGYTERCPHLQAAEPYSRVVVVVEQVDVACIVCVDARSGRLFAAVRVAGDA